MRHLPYSSRYIKTGSYGKEILRIFIITRSSIKRIDYIKVQVTFLKLCLLEVCVALIIRRFTFFFIKIRFQAEKCGAFFADVDMSLKLRFFVRKIDQTSAPKGAWE